MPTHKPKSQPKPAAQPAAEPTPAPAAAPPEQAALTHDQQYQARIAEYRRRFEQLKPILDFFETGHDLELFEYLKLIKDRDHGCTTPVEEFISTIILRYGWADRDGRGLTIDEIESRLETLRVDLDEAIRLSHFVASRHPMPEGEERS